MNNIRRFALLTLILVFGLLLSKDQKQNVEIALGFKEKPPELTTIDYEKPRQVDSLYVRQDVKDPPRIDLTAPTDPSTNDDGATASIDVDKAGLSEDEAEPDIEHESSEVVEAHTRLRKLQHVPVMALDSS